MTAMPRWLIRVALAAYPRAFRRHFGAELASDLESAWQAAERAPLARLALVVRTVTHGLAERAAAVVRLLAWRSHRPHLYTASGPRANQWDGWLRDLRAAMRALLAARGFTALAAAALALGIGANGAILSVVGAVLLKPLPYHDPDRLVMIWSTNPQAGGAPAPVSPADLEDLRTMSRSFAAMDYALAFMVRTALVGQSDEGLLHVSRVGGGLLDVLGAPVQLGRRFRDGERESPSSAIRRGGSASAPIPRSSAAASSCTATRRSRSSASPRPGSCFRTAACSAHRGSRRRRWPTCGCRCRSTGRGGATPADNWSAALTCSSRSAGSRRACRDRRPTTRSPSTPPRSPRCIPAAIVAGARGSSTCTSRPSARYGRRC